MRQERLLPVDAKERWAGSRELVVVDSESCPECGSPVADQTIGQPPLLRHGGYGAMEEHTTRCCVGGCGWRLEIRRQEVKP